MIFITLCYMVLHYIIIIIKMDYLDIRKEL